MPLSAGSGDPSTPRPDLSILYDPERVDAVRELLDSGPPAARIGRFCKLTAGLLETKYAQVSLLADKQWIPAAYGSNSDAQASSALEDSLCAVTIASGATLAIGDAPRHPWVANMAPVARGAIRSYLGAILRTPAGWPVGVLCAYDDRPRQWSHKDVADLEALALALAEELAEHIGATEAASAAAGLDLAVAAGGIGRFDLDLRKGAISWDHIAQGLLGEEPVADLASLANRVPPAERPRLAAAFQAALAGEGDLAVEIGEVASSGRRWLALRGRLIKDLRSRPLRLVGVLYDITEAREAQSRLARVFETMGDAVIGLGTGWELRFLNAAAERLLGISRERLVGRVVWEALAHATGSVFEDQLRRSMTSGQPAVFEAPNPANGSWFEVRAWPHAEGMLVHFRNIDAWRASQEALARALGEREQALAATAEANRRLAIVAAAAERLSSSLEPAEVLEELGRLVVPAYGTSMAVAVTPQTAAMLGHTEPAGDSQTGPGAADGLQTVHIHPSGTTSAVELEAAVGEAGGEGSRIERTPLVSNGRQIGLIVVRNASGSVADKAMLADLAGRAGSALENALLYGSERQLATQLQLNLLPREAASVPGVELALRYLPAGNGALVGGDFYQTLEVGGKLFLCIGDVMGHSVSTAALMGQLRAVVATLANEGYGPADLLSRLGSDAERLVSFDFATMAACVYDPSSRHLDFASAGHPPLLVVGKSGHPSFLGADPGPPLGCGVSSYEQHGVTLEAGAALVLYTDGLVEDRDRPVDLGLSQLLALSLDPSASPDRLAERILRAMGRRCGGGDDVAVLVMRQR